MEHVVFCRYERRDELVSKWRKEESAHFSLALICIVPSVTFAHPPVLSRPQAQVVLMIDVEVKRVAPFEARHRLKDLKFDHDLNPLQKVVFLEKFEVRKDVFLGSLGVLVSQIKIVPDERVLQNEKVKEAV